MIKGCVLCLVIGLLQAFANENVNREKFIPTLEFKSGYNPFRIFGDVPLPPKKSAYRSKLFSNCLCVDVGKVDAVYIRIKVASFLRYNLIRVFGYILHRKHMDLNTDFYTSLYFILTVVKLNHADVISLVDVLNSIAFDKPNKQYEKLFEAMEQHLPQYLSCAATLWKTGIANKTIDMDKILMPYGDDTVVVNILEGITPEELKKVAKPDPPEAPADNVEKKILFDFNKNILRLYQTLKKRTNVKMFPWAIAGLLQFFPRTVIQPDMEESTLVLTQYFYEHNISDFKAIDVKKDHRAPFELVKTYLEAIIKSKNAINIIRDSALTVYRNLKNRSPTAVNPYYTSFTYFVQPDRIKIHEMLKYVSKGAFPLEIVLAADRISYYIDQKIIGYFSMTITFNPYLYSSPIEVLIALLDRIMRRQTELSAEVLDSVGAVYSYLIFKHQYTKIPVTYPTDMSRMSVLIMGFKARDLSAALRQTIDTLTSLLLREHVQYTDILIKKVPIYKCSTPVRCFLELLEEIKKMNEMVDEKIIKLIIQLKIYMIEGYLEIEKSPPSGELYPPEKRNKTIGRYDHEMGEEITTTPATTTSPPPTTPTEGPIKTASTGPPTSPTTPTPPTPQDNEVTLPPPGVLQPIPGNESALLIIVKNLTRSAEHTETQHTIDMVKILEGEEFRIFMKKMKNDHAAIITGFLMFIEETELRYSNKEFVAYLQRLSKKISHAEKVLKEMQIEPPFDQPALFSLTVAVPAPSEEEEQAKFDLLKSVLAKQELFIIIHNFIKKTEMATVGALLKAVLREEAKLTKILSKEELEAVKYYMDKVQEHGIAESKIIYTYHQEIISREIDVSAIMDNALSFKDLDHAGQVSFNVVIHHLQVSNFLQEWNKWYLYNTCGEFTQAMFKRLLETPSLPADVREALQTLTPKINLDKNGKKPAFPLKNK